MTSKTALFALFALWGVCTTASLPVMAQDVTPDSQTESKTGKTGLTDRVWVKVDSPDLPGVMRIFLSDGTMVSDSCWETHRLSQWQMTADNAISWNEDGMDIKAEISTLAADELVLRLALGSETVEERYTSATVPYLCPDIPK